MKNKSYPRCLGGAKALDYRFRIQDYGREDIKHQREKIGVAVIDVPVFSTQFGLEQPRIITELMVSVRGTRNSWFPLTLSHLSLGIARFS
jgi:hypothetical protein